MEDERTERDKGLLKEHRSMFSQNVLKQKILHVKLINAW